MKRAYVRPTMVGERFVANEYVAACGDSGTVYKFKCDAGGGESGVVYEESNGKDDLQARPVFLGGDRRLGPYHACGVTHEAEVQDKFLKGYYVCGGSVTDVIIWRGEDGDNVHCTTNLKQETWGTAKS